MLSIDTLPSLDNTANLVRYRRHRPEETTLYPIKEQHLPRFLTHIAEHATQLPRFVTQEFDDYLACGRLEHGFLRVKCNGCRHEHLVAFSCKCRGFCPSCGARHMVYPLIVPPLLRDALQLHNGVVYPGLAIRLTDVDIATMETAAIQKLRRDGRSRSGRCTL